MVLATITKTGEIAPTNNIFKEIVIETDAGAVTAETIDITLLDFGCTLFEGISMAQIHTTVNSVVVDEPDFTTSVTSGVLEIVIGGTAATGKRIYKVLMR